MNVPTDILRGLGSLIVRGRTSVPVNYVIEIPGKAKLQEADGRMWGSAEHLAAVMATKSAILMLQDGKPISIVARAVGAEPDAWVDFAVTGQNIRYASAS